MSGLVISFSWVVLSSVVATSASETQRPRVTIAVAKLDVVGGETVISGVIQARYETNVSFRIGGKIIARTVDVGAHVLADQVIAKISPEGQQADLRSAEAALASAKAALAQAELTDRRQSELIKDRFTTGQTFDRAEQELKQAEAQVTSGVAQVGDFKERLSYTDLKAGITGVVTVRDAEVGQVVKEGDAIFKIAQDGPRDAVFNVHESLVAEPPAGKTIQVILQSDPSVRADATVREVAPTVDSSTGAVRVKAELSGNVPRLSLGAPVLGEARLGEANAVILPWSALSRWRDAPAVWIVEGDVANPRTIMIRRYQGQQVIVADGIRPGERVVIEGLQFLRPGVQVVIAAGTPP